MTIPPVPHTWNMSEAIQKSSNSFFAFMADRLGAERLAWWYRRFGIGVTDAIDVTWQRPGVLVTPSTVTRYRLPEPHWNPYDRWAMGIGQFIKPAASPLQLVSIPAAIANGGTILRPHLWSGVSNQAVKEQLDIPPAILREVQRGMEMVTDPGGTANKLSIRLGDETIKIAAKTGTSEWGNRSTRARGDTPDNS